MPTTTIAVVEVKPKTITTRRGPATIYEVTAEDGRIYSSFNKDWLQKAGQTVSDVEYEEVQKGQYVNYRIRDPRKPSAENGAIMAELAEIKGILQVLVEKVTAR